jgi:hypothetical protein
MFLPFYHLFPGDDSADPECVGKYIDQLYNMMYILNMIVFIWDYLNNNFNSSLRKHQSLQLHNIPAIMLMALLCSAFTPYHLVPFLFYVSSVS